MDEVGPQLPRILQLRGECQRIFYYGLISMTVMNAAVIGLPLHFNPDIKSQDWVEFLVVINAVFLPLVYIGLPRKWIVDDRGITRKTIFSDQLWTWDDFASRRVIKKG